MPTGSYLWEIVPEEFVHIVQHTEGHTPHSQSAKSSNRFLAKLFFLSWMNNSLKDTSQYLESLFCHLITCGSDPGVQVFQLDHLSCSVHHYFLPEIITKSHQLSVMTTRRNFSSPSLVTQLLFFARSVPIYLPCYIPPLVQNKWSVGEWEKESSAWTPLHKNYNSSKSTGGQHCLVSSFLKRD